MYLPQTEQSKKQNLISFPLNPPAREATSEDSSKHIPTPLFEEMVQEGHRLDSVSSYKSNFNYEIYRSLERRFYDKSIRGGLICKTNLKLANFHTSCFKCHYTLELDTYGRGCIHECAYCYAKDELSLHGYWNNPLPLPINLNDLRQIFYTVFETDKKSKWREVLAKRIPIRLGSMSDSFMWTDLKYGVTREVLKILKHYEYPHLVFTRSDLVAHNSYMEIMDPKLTSIQFSICGSNQELTKLIEPGAPSISRRFQAISKLSSAGFWVGVRINPLFPKYPDGYFSDPSSIISRFGSREHAPTFDLFDIDNADQFMFDLATAGAKTVLTGFVRLKSSSINTMSRATGIDLKPMFKPEVINTGLRGNREKKYSDPEIRYYYTKLAGAAAKNGIRFSTCYIGNGAKDYYQYQELWANRSDCCDVKGNVSSFKESSQSIPWTIRAKHSPNATLVTQSENEERRLDSLFQDPKVDLKSNSDLLNL